MATIAPTVATPPVPTTGPLPPPLPPDPPTGDPGADNRSVRLRINSWLEGRVGRAALPVAAAAGGVLGGGLGFLALGPVGAVLGGAAGAFGGALFFMAG